MLHDGELPPGQHRIAWDGSDGRGVRAASGVYFAALRTPEQKLGRRKLTLVKYFANPASGRPKPKA